MIDTQITHTYIGREFMWDRVSDADPELLRNNRTSAMRVLNSPASYPNADFDKCEEMVREIDNFFHCYGSLLDQFA